MIRKKRTTLVRMRVDTKNKLQKAYPQRKMSELIDIAYNTSPLRLEISLRELDKKLDRMYGWNENKKFKKK